MRVKRTEEGAEAGMGDGRGAGAAGASAVAKGSSGVIASGRRGWRTRIPGLDASRSIRLSARTGWAALGIARSSKTSDGQACGASAIQSDSAP